MMVKKTVDVRRQMLFFHNLYGHISKPHVHSASYSLSSSLGWRDRGSWSCLWTLHHNTQPLLNFLYSNIVFTACYVSTQLLHLHYIHYCYLTQEQINTWYTHDGKKNNSSLMSAYKCYSFIIIMAISPSLMFRVLHTLSSS